MRVITRAYLPGSSLLKVFKSFPSQKFVKSFQIWAETFSKKIVKRFPHLLKVYAIC